MSIVGYTDPLSLAPGDSIRAMISARAPSFRASLERLAGSGGPAKLESEADGTYASEEQPLRAGSFAVVDETPPLSPGGGFTVEALVWPTAPGGAPQAILSCYDGSRGYALGVDQLGRAALWLDGEVVSTGEPLRRRAWYRLRASYDPKDHSASIVQEPVERWPGAVEAVSVERAVGTWTEPKAPFCIAAWGERADAHYNGKIEAPRLFDSDGSLIAGWDLGGDFASDELRDITGRGRHGRCVNLPMRAVTGHSWRGLATDAALTPEEYAAVWFHDDDLEDARWQPAFELRLPADLPNGVYAFRVDTGEDVDLIPFFVRPQPGRAHSRVAVLLPTLSYLAYGNEHSSWANPISATPRIEQVLASVGARDRYAAEHRLKSIYEMHTDGSGVAYASRLRPIVNMRPDHGMPLLCGGPHQFPADLELLEWLDHLDIAYDVLTDEDLHHEGAALLSGYRVLLTGSHPEYWTEAMLDGLQSWLDGGGRLMYLGGNGFYWVTSLFGNRPHVLEVRRGHAGTGVWRSEPGEVHHASTGEPGGLWRFRGRPPHRVAGIGFAAQGFDESLPYRVRDGVRDSRAAWILEGVDSDEIGAHGSVLHGAAGFEVDRVDTALGTPPHALVVATARGFTDAYQAASEDIMTSDSRQGGTVSPHVRADMVFFERPNGGAVFSTGSIAWCGALLDNNCVNDVSRITENVLRRFSEGDGDE